MDRKEAVNFVDRDGRWDGTTAKIRAESTRVNEPHLELRREAHLGNAWVAV